MKYDFVNGIVIGILISFACVLIFTMLKKRALTIYESFPEFMFSPATGKVMQSKVMQFVRTPDGKTKWEVNEFKDGQSKLSKGDGVPPDEIMDNIAPDLEAIKKLMGNLNISYPSKKETEPLQALPSVQ